VRGAPGVILEGFEIEHWACIRKVAVANLSPTGVVVLHGRNRTGKSSIVKALRACLMDYPSTSGAQALKSLFPRGGAEKPTVSVTFRTSGEAYRVSKTFGSSKSSLERRTTAGAWTMEETSAAEVHRRVCELVGGDDSTKGLQQLLWLEQGQFALPDGKKFDDGVRQRLRGILGVLQTPLDDRFLERVKERWKTWHAGERKAGKTPSVKKGSSLASSMERLNDERKELAAKEAEFVEAERLVRRSAELESTRYDLARQLERQSGEFKRLSKEGEQVRARISAKTAAEKDYSNAEKEHREALTAQWEREQAAKRFADAERELRPAEEAVTAAGRKLEAAAGELGTLQQQRSAAMEQLRAVQERSEQVGQRLKGLEYEESLKSAERDYERAAALEREATALEKGLAEHPAPDEATLKGLKDNRLRRQQLQAERDAAAISLTLAPEPGAPGAALTVDGAKVAIEGEGPHTRPVQRAAQLVIPGWGRVEIKRGSAADVDQLEAQLKKCDEQFTEAAASFGVSAGDANALDVLINRAAEYRQASKTLVAKKGEFKQQAPKGLAPFHAKVVEWRTKLESIAAAETTGDAPPMERAELESLAAAVQRELEQHAGAVRALDERVQAAERGLQQTQAEEANAKETRANRRATTEACGKELQRLKTAEELAERVAAAKRGLDQAQEELNRAKLTDEETTFEERLGALETAVAALDAQLRDTDAEINLNKGRLMNSEGLHAKRAALAARVDELTRTTEREELERLAVDRLYELFEECRDRQLGTLLEPVHDRVLSWMRVLDLGDYREVKFGDAFLPERLVGRDGAGEFAVHEESTGAQEQIGLLVRLALGSLLSSAGDPASAILDDPLTHCDVGRLTKLRGIIRRAGEGDASATPPIGPLQILIMTCHPEWFRDERAMVIDLENPEVLQRSA